MAKYGYDEINDKFTCPEGKKLEYVKTRYDKTETGFIQENRVYECSDCSNCTHKSDVRKHKEIAKYDLIKNYGN